MQLTKLEIKGFKSFGDKITINFNEGVTAIVGPNGCGKSNVVDAIRWVLGEQSTKMLRSEKMENIIFNGTKNRKASNLAEVSLTFDNTKNILPTEFSNVTITRKLYRNGESEYRLNDVKCRLKDITDLFLDTGIGADSYSIIELRMIDEIINNKEHSRRILFEEASGISKYKIRKKQTINKLKDTQTDLDRVDDLLFEVEKNLKSLENQAKKTERYYRIKGEYKQASVALAKWRIAEFKISFQETEQMKSDLENRLLTCTASLHQGESLLQNLKQQVLTKEKNLALQQKVTNEQLHKIRAYESEKKVKNEQLRNLQDREQRLSQEIAQDKQQVNHALYNLKRLQEELLVEEGTLEDLKGKVESKKLETDALRGQQQSKKTTLDIKVKDSQKAQQAIYDKEKEIAVLHIQKDALDQESLRNRVDTESKEVELHQFSLKVAELSEKTDELQSQYDFALEQESKLQEQLQKAELRILDLKDELNRENRLIDAKQNEYNLTKSLVDNLEGFPESIRFLRKNAQWKQAYPLFSDILFCREEYRIAIENYLDPLMNHYVVSNTDEAIHAIRLLSDSARGRANFFILESVGELESSQPDIGDIIENPEGIKLIAALSVISVDEKYKQLCRILLENVYLIQDPQQDENVAAPYPDAVVLHPMGKFSKQKLGLSGGSVGLFEGKRIGRAKNLENLAKEIKKAQDRTKNLDRELQETSTQVVAWKASSQKILLEELMQNLNRFQHELISVKTKKEQYETFILNSKNRKQDIAEKLDQIQETLRVAEPALTQMRLTTVEEDRKLAELQDSYRELSDELTELSSAFNQENLKFHQQQNKTQNVLKDIEYRESQRDSFEVRLEKNQRDLDDTKSAIQEVLKHVDHSDDDLLAMYEQKDQMEAGLLAMEHEFQKDRQAIQSQEDEIRSERGRKESLDREYQEIKDRENQIRMELNSLKERLSVEFNLDIRDFLDEPQTESADDPEGTHSQASPVPEGAHIDLDLGQYADANQSFLTDKTQKLKKQLEDFGAINPMAMEAYQEMDARYQFITKEKSDLLESKNSLLATISEIDQVARDKFMEAFETVRQHFITVFRSLFNSEDNCDLILTDPNDPLGSDIDIIARPKGKRPLSINQLSGGEKTLTSTALLFSLYLLKPAPFCIFDEVDAPLDDTNIDKFNNIIREFSNQSQFIIVSHNKRTIASTDVIYGVTMIEQGVSRVVAVDLRDVA